MDAIRSKGRKASAREISSQALHIVYEAICRGIEFLPVDLYLSHSYKFLMEAANPPAVLLGKGARHGCGAGHCRGEGKGRVYIVR